MNQQSKNDTPQLNNEVEILAYFSIRISDGVYIDVYEFLDDLSMMIYPLINCANEKATFVQLKSLVGTIQRNIKHNHFFSDNCNLRTSFDNMWRYSIKQQYIKSIVKVFCTDIKLSSKGRFIYPHNINKKCEISPDPSGLLEGNNATIPDLKTLYRDSVSFVVSEERILWVYNSLVEKGTWGNVYDFLGSVSYVLFNQLIYGIISPHKLSSYKILGDLLLKIKAIILNYSCEIYGYSTEVFLSKQFVNEKISSFVSIWKKHYSVYTIRKITAIFPSITDIGNMGEIILKEHEQDILLCPTSIEVDKEVPQELQTLYDDVDSFIIPEKKIIAAFNSQEVWDYWENIYDFLASLFYIIITQISFVGNRKALRYVVLRNLSIIAVNIKKKYSSMINIEERDECIKQLRKILKTLFGIKIVKRLARDFSITYAIDEQGRILKGIKDEITEIEDLTSSNDEEDSLNEDSDIVVLRLLKW